MLRTAYRLPFRMLGVPVHLDVSFLLVLPLLAWVIGNDLERYLEFFQLESARSLLGGVVPYLLGLSAALGLFLSVLVHELGHAVVARAYGSRARRIVLWVLGGLAQFDEMPRQRGAEAVVAAAGPVTSLLLAFLCRALFTGLLPQGAALQFLGSYLFFMNIMLALFNLLPALPLDGGRVLRSLLAVRMPRLRATRIAASVSRILAFFLGLLGVLTLNFLMILIALFIFLAVKGESRGALLSELLHDVRVADIMTPQVRTVTPRLSVDQLLQKMFEEHRRGYPVVDEAGRLVGVVTLDELRASGRDAGQTVEHLMSDRIARISEQASAWDAFQEMRRRDVSRLAVVGEYGELSGIITRVDLFRALQEQAGDF